MTAAKVVFPYRSMSEAARDRYEKLGGPENALRFLRHGYKYYIWRERWKMRKREQEAREDAEFVAAHGDRRNFAALSPALRKEGR